MTLACSNAVAMMWLMPRMGSFWRARDYRRADVELRIRYGFGAWPDETAQLLLTETIHPVCSPRFAAKYEGDTRP